jgi:urease subunit beta
MAGVSTAGPGAIRVQPGELEINADRSPDECRELTFTNTADRPIQVGSHLHLPDVNPGLEFDRSAAQGFRLDIPAGTSLRFEPGASRTAGNVHFLSPSQIASTRPTS